MARALLLPLLLLSSVAGCYQSHGLTGGPCEVTEDCAPSPVGCAQAICIDGTCQLIPIPDSCGPDAVCDVVLGCVGPDAPDGGMDAPADGLLPFDALEVGPSDARFEIGPGDAPLDGGFDAPGLDAPLDAPRFDAPFFDVPLPFDAPPDAPRFDAPIDAPRRDAPRFDAPVDAPRRDAPRADAPRADAPRDAPRFDVPPPIDAPRLDTPPDVPRDARIDAPPPTSSARRCRPDSVLTMLDHPLFGTEESTLELWARVRGPGVIARKGDSRRRYFELRVEGTGDATTLVAGWGTDATEVFARTPFAAFVGTYTHLAVVYHTSADGTAVMELYVNAVLVASTTLPGLVSDAFNAQSFFFCSFDGDLDEIRFWGGALSPMLLEARRFGTVPGDTPGLDAYWPLEGRSQVILDRTLHGADGVAGDVSTPDPRDPLAIPDGAF